MKGWAVIDLQRLFGRSSIYTSSSSIKPYVGSTAKPSEVSKIPRRPQAPTTTIPTLRQIISRANKSVLFRSDGHLPRDADRRDSSQLRDGKRAAVYMGKQSDGRPRQFIRSVWRQIELYGQLTSSSRGPASRRPVTSPQWRFKALSRSLDRKTVSNRLRPDRTDGRARRLWPI